MAGKRAMLTLREVAKRLRVSERTVYNWLKAGKLQAVLNQDHAGPQAKETR